MGNWYYVDDEGQRQGPISSAALTDLFNAHGVHSGNLAWREGLSDWQPLRGFLAELGLSEPELPPPLNPRPTGPVFDSAQSSPAPSTATPQYPIQPTHDAAGNIVYAGFWRRYLALFIDQLVLAIPLLLLTVALGFALGLFKRSSEDAVLLFQGIYFAIFLMLAPLYYALQESSRHQATLGKRAMGIKVTDLAGNRLGFAHALGRWFSASLSYLTMYVGFLMAAFTARKQALHDVVASTLVTDRWAFTAHPERQKQGLSGCLIALLVALVAGIPVLAILAAIALPAYQTYVARATVAQGVATARSLSLTAATFQAEQGRCPTNGEGGLGEAASYASERVASIEIGSEEDSGHCIIQVTLKPGLGGSSEDKYIWLEQDAPNGTWHCSSDMEDRNLPKNCKG